MSAPLRCLATTSPGLEPLLAGEVARLGADAVLTDHGSVEFDTNADLLADALLGLRTAHRVTVRLAAFRARTFAELERHAAAIAWNGVLDPAGAVHFRVTSKKSRLYHQDAVAERLERSVVAALPRVEMVRAAGAAEQREAEVDRLPDVQRFIVRLHRDEVTISGAM